VLWKNFNIPGDPKWEKFRFALQGDVMFSCTVGR
jgi:phage gpG-like protein